MGIVILSTLDYSYAMPMTKGVGVLGYYAMVTGISYDIPFGMCHVGCKSLPHDHVVYFCGHVVCIFDHVVCFFRNYNKLQFRIFRYE